MSRPYPQYCKECIAALIDMTIKTLIVKTGKAEPPSSGVLCIDKSKIMKCLCTGCRQQLEKYLSPGVEIMNLDEIDIESEQWVEGEDGWQQEMIQQQLNRLTEKV
jgi:hypothetical protein